MGCGTSVHVGIVTPALEDGCKRFVVPLGLSLTECATIAESYPGLTGGKDDLEPADICARFGVMHTTFAEKIFNVLRESSTFTVHNPISITKVKGRGGEGRVCVWCGAVVRGACGDLGDPELGTRRGGATRSWGCARGCVRCFVLECVRTSVHL